MTPRTTAPDDLTPGTHDRTVVGIFADRSDAEDAIRALKDAGFTDSQVGVALLDKNEQRQLIQNTGSTAAETAATGAVSGGLVGGLIGLLGSLLIPGVGPIVAGGVLASTLAGAGIGAATGGLIGALMGLGVPEEDARHFNRGLESGSVLVTVNAGDRIPEALEILERHNVDFGPSRGERFRSPDTATTAGAGTGSAYRTGDLDEQQRMQLREEQLLVDKERVDAGEVRIRKEVVTEQQNIEVPVTREEVVIERRTAADVDAAGEPIGGSEEIRVPLAEERVNVEKRPVVREEISVGKRTVHDTEEVSDTVRREEARIETEGRTTARPLDSRAARPYKGKERRRRAQTSYSGPERREAVL
jgi:uncharacterized protein (TIGR02271 family)